MVVVYGRRRNNRGVADGRWSRGARGQHLLNGLAVEREQCDRRIDGLRVSHISLSVQYPVVLFLVQVVVNRAYAQVPHGLRHELRVVLRQNGDSINNNNATQYVGNCRVVVGLLRAVFAFGVNTVNPMDPTKNPNFYPTSL